MDAGTYQKVVFIFPYRRLYFSPHRAFGKVKCEACVVVVATREYGVDVFGDY